MTKYSTRSINSLSVIEWNNLIIKELNSKNIKSTSPDEGKDTEGLKAIYKDEIFVPIQYSTKKDLSKLDKEEIDNLKQLGLLNNSRCPYCGNEINNNPIDYRNKSKDLSYHICSKCSKRLLRNKTIGIILNIIGIYLIFCLIYFVIISNIDISPIHLFAIYALVHGGNKLKNDDINRSIPIWKKILVYSIEILLAFILAVLIVIVIKNIEIAKWIFVILIFCFSKIFPPKKFFKPNTITNLQDNHHNNIIAVDKENNPPYISDKHKLSVFQMFMIGLSIALCTALSVFIFNSSSEMKLKNTAIAYVKEISPDADVEIEKIINDTILPFYLNSNFDFKQHFLDMKLELSSLNRNKNFNSHEMIKDWDEFCSNVKDFQNEKYSLQINKHIIFLKSNEKNKVDTCYHIIIIDGNRMDKVENHYFLGDKFHKDLLHKVVYLLIPIDLYDKGHFNRKDYLIWLKDNTSDIKNTTDSIYNILDNHFTN